MLHYAAFHQGLHCLPKNALRVISIQRVSDSVADPEGVEGVCSNPPLRQNYFIFMENFQKKSGKVNE